MGILSAILFPVFAQARERARTATCLSNLRQIGLANLMYVQDYDERFPFAGRDWPAASFIDVWNGLGAYIKNTEKTQYGLQVNSIRFPTSYYYYLAFYHNFDDRQQPGPPVSMPTAACLYPAQKAIFVCFAGNEGRAHNSDMMMLSMVDGHSRLVPVARINEAKPWGAYNLDWTLGGLAGKDLKE